jgi:two-component system, sporulation sensor kinase E
VIGTFSFGSKQKPSFTREDLSLIEIVASQLSIALQRKKDEELVKTTRKRFYDSLTNMHGSLLLLSPNKRVEFVNQSFCDCFNLKETPSELQDLTLEEMLGKIKGSFLCPDQEISRIREIVAAGNQ